MAKRRRASPLAIAVLTFTLLAGCGGDDRSDEGDGTTLTVYAAASLTTSFEAIAAEFEEQHDGVAVELAFGGSADLVAQVQQGAPADVFASADAANMAKLTGDGLGAAAPEHFATNTLEIAVPPGNPGGVETFADLAEDGLDVVVCAPEVPCGAAAVRLEETTGVDISPVSEEQSVTGVLGKVTSGEADAGLVYLTDVIAAGDDVEGIPFPESAEALNSYPIVVLADARDTDLARAFVELVLDDTGQRILQDAGFAPAGGMAP